MKLLKPIACIALLAVVAGTLFSCQKMYRPELGEIMYDPEPPPYEPLKSFFNFDGNLNDAGENDLTGTPVNTRFVAGVKGEAIAFDAGGYLLLPVVGDTVRYPNEIVGLPADSIAALGSLTVAFWMNVPGPVQGGAQGVFSISNRNLFWGNFDIFLENFDGGDEAFLKVHMFNTNAPNGVGEQWNEVKIPGALNKWTHIAVTYDANTSSFTIYADGTPTAINNKILDGGNYGRLAFKDFNGMVIGNHHFQTTPSLTNHGPQSWASQVKGPIDNFRLYNRALTASEINALYTGND